MLARYLKEFLIVPGLFWGFNGENVERLDCSRKDLTPSHAPRYPPALANCPRPAVAVCPPHRGGAIWRVGMMVGMDESDSGGPTRTNWEGIVIAVIINAGILAIFFVRALFYWHN